MKNSYNWTFKRYPDTANVATCGDLFRLETVTYKRPERGTRWIETGRNLDLVNADNYFNVVSAVPFFRNLGGREVVSAQHTVYGYIPFKIVSTDPSGTLKTVRRFIF